LSAGVPPVKGLACGPSSRPAGRSTRPERCSPTCSSGGPWARSCSCP